MNDWWLIIRTPSGLHLYQLGDVDGDAQGAAVEERSAEHAVPQDWWDHKDEGWELALTTGEPHRSLIESATAVNRLEGRS